MDREELCLHAGTVFIPLKKKPDAAYPRDVRRAFFVIGAVEEFT